MKKILFLFVVASFLFSCNSDSGKTEIVKSISPDHTGSAALTLNNGAKWKADSITNRNVGNIKTIADNFRIKPLPTVAEYQLLSNDLSNGLNTMIQECKMTGADHEALHHWLESILKDTKELKNVSDTAAGRSIFKSLDHRIDEYHTYFE